MRATEQHQYLMDRAAIYDLLLRYVAMRSLRYIDKLRRTEDGWRIYERVHTLDWSCEVPTTFAVAAAERVATAR